LMNWMMLSWSFVSWKLSLEKRNLSENIFENSNTSLFITEDEVIIATFKKLSDSSIFINDKNLIIDNRLLIMRNKLKKMRIDFSSKCRKKHTCESK
jgi:hypothetical protein